VGFVTFSGVVVGPPLFALIASFTSSYRASFAALGAVSGGCALWLFLRQVRGLEVSNH
jgi:hypothetical protein